MALLIAFIDRIMAASIVSMRILQNNERKKRQEAYCSWRALKISADLTGVQRLLS
jgi:hypothetical protein